MTLPVSRNSSVDTPNSQASALAFARATSLPGGDVTAWLREKFPELPPDDFCDSSYSCALFRSILLQGRMYVTCTGLAFYAKIFGRVTKEYIPFAKMRCVRKRGGGFVANAIKVEFLDENIAPVIFGSLSRRERALALITVKLCSANPMACGGSQDGDERGEWDADDDVTSPEFRSKSVPSQIAVGNAQRMHREGSSPDSVEDGSSEQFVMDGLERAFTEGKPSYQSSKGDERIIGRIASPDASLPSVPQQRGSVERSNSVLNDEVSARGGAISEHKGLWMVDGDVMDRISGQAYSAKVEQARRVLKAPIKRVFDLLFAGSWMLEVHGKNGNTELTETPWARGEDGFMTRTLQFNRALGYRIGPKATRVIETHRYSFTSSGGAILETCGHNLDVPLGDSFRVEGYIELSPSNGGKSTAVVASVAVHFTKSSMLRGKIESGAISETKETYTRLLDLAELKIEAESADDAVLPAPNERRDSSLNKRGSGNFAKCHLVVTDSPPKKSRQGSVLSDASTTGPHLTHSDQPAVPILAGDVHGSLPVAASKGVDITGHRDGVDPLRLTVVILLAVIALLLVICVIILSKLQFDVLRLEKLAVYAVDLADNAGLKAVCSTDGVVLTTSQAS